MAKTAFDIICSGCKYRELTYCAKAEDYGQDGVGWHCNKEEWGIEKCPRASQWREYFKHENEQGVSMRPNTPLSSGIIPPKFTPGGITWVYEQSKSANPPEQMTIDATETLTVEVHTLGGFH